MALVQFFQDERDRLSSTRLVGIMSGLTLCLIGYAQAFSVIPIKADAEVVQALEYVCISCLLWGQLPKLAPRRGAQPKGETQ